MHKYRFRNASVAMLSLFGVIIGIVIISVGHRARYELLGAVICAYSAYAAYLHYLGVVIADDAVHFPLPVTPLIPFLVVGRTHVGVSDIQHIKVLGNWFGFEAIDVDARYKWRLLFASRDARREFLQALSKARAGIYIYRASRD